VTTDADTYQEENGNTPPPHNSSVGAEERTQDYKMIDLTANAKIIGDRFIVCCHIFNTIVKCVIEPVQLFHKQWLAKEEAKQIKAAIKLPQLSDTTQRVAQIIASE
jgi:hypothetical protein